MALQNRVAKKEAQKHALVGKPLEAQTGEVYRVLWEEGAAGPGPGVG